jgi:hypothetical protein
MVNELDVFANPTPKCPLPSPTLMTRCAEVYTYAKCRLRPFPMACYFEKFSRRNSFCWKEIKCLKKYVFSLEGNQKNLTKSVRNLGKKLNNSKLYCLCHDAAQKNRVTQMFFVQLSNCLDVRHVFKNLYFSP